MSKVLLISMLLLAQLEDEILFATISLRLFITQTGVVGILYLISWHNGPYYNPSTNRSLP